MKILVTGSAGHLGEGPMRSLEVTGHEAIGAEIYLPRRSTNAFHTNTDNQQLYQAVAMRSASGIKPHFGDISRSTA